MSKLIESAAGTCTCAPPCWEQAKNVLEEEANVLAMWLDSTLDTTYPHRVGIAVLREIKRLRDLGAGLASSRAICLNAQGAPEEGVRQHTSDLCSRCHHSHAPNTECDDGVMGFRKAS